MPHAELLASYFTLAGDHLPLRHNGPSPLDFRARVEAAGRAGFAGMGLFFTDLPAVIERYGYAGMRAILADNGINRIEVEALIDWFADGERAAAMAEPRKLMMKTAEALGAFHIKAGGDMSGDCPMDRMIESFSALCDEAAAIGTRISIEMIAFSNIHTLQRAATLIRGADRRNGGLMLDIWHVERGAVPLAEVAALPGSMIFGVELNDSLQRIQGTLFEDTIFHRRFCGEGEFDVAGFVAAVKAAGYVGPWGIELLSDEVRAMPLDRLADKAYRTTAQFLG